MILNSNFRNAAICFLQVARWFITTSHAPIIPSMLNGTLYPKSFPLSNIPSNQFWKHVNKFKHVTTYTIIQLSTTFIPHPTITDTSHCTQKSLSFIFYLLSESSHYSVFNEMRLVSCFCCCCSFIWSCSLFFLLVASRVASDFLDLYQPMVNRTCLVCHV